MMMSFNDFNQVNGLKNKAASNIQFKIILLCLSLSDVGNPLGKWPFSSDFGTVKIHPTKPTHWVA